ncbi:MAG TPA: hypothetical protein VF980_10400 [Thermoanaerobaculia bacterium]
MPRRDLKQLSDEAYIWIFGISPALDEAGTATLLRRVDAFLDNWAAHGTPIESARDLREGSLLIIAAESTSERSGCSIDRLFGTLRQLEDELHVKILDPNRVFFRHGDGRVDAMSRAEFREKGDPHTVVFDTTAQTLSEVRGGSWERRAELSWHRELLKKPAAVR